MSRRTTIEAVFPVPVRICVLAEVYSDTDNGSDLDFGKAMLDLEELLSDAAWEEIEAIVARNLPDIARRRRTELAEERERSRGKAKMARITRLADVGRGVIRCANCGLDDPNMIEVDHIHPMSRGGSNSSSNLQLLCRACNSAKGAKTMDEWLR